MLIASSGVLHFFKAPDTNSIHLTHRPDRADQNCPDFSIPRMTKYCNKYCNAGENVLLRWRKKAADRRNIRHLLRNSPPDCFCQMLRIWSLVSQVQILQINKKGSRTFRLLHRQKCVIEHRDIRHSLRNSPPDCFCQMLRIWSLVSQVQILQINKKGSRTFRLLHRQKCVIEHRDIRHSLRNSPPDCFCQMLRIWSLVSQVQIL